ncbi:hypothetical protein [Anaeromyxobacter oryzae]|uniref:Lipoprotein n=1 Tax=Anaeromyxobacter oryzae TaxID=2918170 RepID=A0ABN6MWI1_9BACT|nr:hypothetical protein [Anaeromyxobacter oryzae]BDG05285.1 hypothetical protein AMOR_42810 [Anaeromyxobacter oryzae]
MSIRRSLLAASAAVLAACAQPAAHRLGASARLARFPPRPPAARAPFQPPRGDAIFANAVHVLADAGYAVDSCDADLGAVATERVELDVPCFGGTCLARDTVKVKLGYKMAKVIVVRELWDWSLKEWAPIQDEDLRDGVTEEETALLARIMDVPRPTLNGPERFGDPCRPGPCAVGVCIGLAPVAAP